MIRVSEDDFHTRISKNPGTFARKSISWFIKSESLRCFARVLKPGYTLNKRRELLESWTKFSVF